MNSDESLPDYYAILQVHPEAEAEIIEVAYRRLMRKYHPDALAPDQRDDPQVLSRVRAINVAYDVLSDPNQRAAYDGARATEAQAAQPHESAGLETHVILVRCARSRAAYRMLVGRKADDNILWRVLGFELLERAAKGPSASPKTDEPPALPEPPASAGPLRRLMARFKRIESKLTEQDGPSPGFPSPEEMQALLNNEASVGFAEIDWGGWRCPSCNGEFVHSDGTVSIWCKCASCAHIFCAGDFHPALTGPYSRCPWCGRRVRLTSIVRPGDAVDLPVKGELGHFSPGAGKALKAGAPGSMHLPGGGRGTRSG